MSSYLIYLISWDGLGQSEIEELVKAMTYGGSPGNRFRKCHRDPQTARQALLKGRLHGQSDAGTGQHTFNTQPCGATRRPRHL